jgi:hypothetical protein
VEEFGDGVVVALTDAGYAGTKITACFRATLYRSLPGWLLRIEHDAWSENVEVDLAAWLTGGLRSLAAGTMPARSRNSKVGYALADASRQCVRSIIAACI